MIAEYRELYSSSNSAGKILLVARLTWAAVQIIGGTAVFALNISTPSTLNLEIALLLYITLLLAVIVFRPQYYRLAIPNPHNDPDLMNREYRRRALIHRLDTFFLLPYIAAAYFMISGQGFLPSEAPSLFYFVFVLLGVGTAYIVGPFLLMVFFCLVLPCIYGYLLYQQRREGVYGANAGATEELIASIPIFTFKRKGDPESGIPMPPLQQSPSPKKKNKFKLTQMFKKKDDHVDPEPTFLELDQEDSTCCICLTEYEAGASLRQLSCKHHFHTECIDEWLRLNAKCPLCVQNLKE
ncbi:hypothetical protein EDD86DRAFT_211183 [Gorgonomyces haynaldii]|nr:hypothetical protein EDD86DRAFT_211183 [Gorgonomyces haynaldii]